MDKEREKRDRFPPVLAGLALLVFLAGNSWAWEYDKPLTFEDRVRAQEAIERVYYNHRIWPKENPGPKPPFELMITREQLEAKVEDYLKKSAALDKYWQRPLTGEQLQAEMDRIAKQTKDPATLRELFAALDNDPYLVAECLVRPILSDRLIRNWYAFDTRFHTVVKARAEALLRKFDESGWFGNGEEHADALTIILKEEESESEAALPGPEGEKQRIMRLGRPEWDRAASRHGAPGDPPRLIEEAEGFIVTRTLRQEEGRLEVESRTVDKRQFDEWWEEQRCGLAIPAPEAVARYILSAIHTAALEIPACDTWVRNSMSEAIDPRTLHTAVWTGTEMIVFGGLQGNWGHCVGGRYNPAIDAWASIAPLDSIQGRSSHTAIWTGSEMIVWGGLQGSYTQNTGGRYDPVSDTWIGTSRGANCPSVRRSHTSVWTGTEMIIWGGTDGSSVLNTGGRYDPVTDTWSATPIGGGCPVARYLQKAVWTGTVMIIWGGLNATTTFNTGARFDPAANSWSATSTGPGCPSPRYWHTAVWTGETMIVWGGSSTNTGGRYDPLTDTWSATSTGSGCPSVRNRHTAVWTGSEMIVWGGYGSGYPSYYLNDGSRYDPLTDAWIATAIGWGCPAPRYRHTAVWTGTEMIIWGGFNDTTYFTIGGRYNPVSDTWVPTAAGNPGPGPRRDHAAVWTGSEMIVWGGSFYDNAYHNFNTGGRYDPALDAWRPTSTGSACPTPRSSHTAVWTGSQMIIYGGNFSAPPYSYGGRYDPVADSWLTVTGGSYSRLAGQTAVWTGTEMIIWGGWRSGPVFPLEGGCYNPQTDSWRATSTGSGCPSGRAWHSAVWSGKEMIVWGGGASIWPEFGDGGSYDPATDAWSAIPATINSPLPRYMHTAVWTGSVMILWGGGLGNGVTTQTGATYDPTTTIWTPTSTGAHCPVARSYHEAVWTGTEMIVWGGSYSSGGHYDWTTDTWTPTAQGPFCPSRRYAFTAVWTGSAMIVYGGEPYTSTGGIYSHRLIPPVYGPHDACSKSGATLSTDSYLAYQWFKDGGEIPGAMEQSYSPEVGGSYSVLVVNGLGCKGGSADWTLALHPPPLPTIVGEGTGCTFPGVDLETQTFAFYQWFRDGIAIPLATGRVYKTFQSGIYWVVVRDTFGCEGISQGIFVIIHQKPGSPVITDIVDPDPDQQTGIKILYTPGSDAARHDLYRDDVLAVTDYLSGADYDPGDSVCHSYKVQAVNQSCFTDSLSMSAQDGIEPPTTVLQLSIVGPITGTVTFDPPAPSCGGLCTIAAVPGSTVVLSANPGPNEEFVQWIGDCVGSAPQCTLSMDGTKLVAAYFKPRYDPYMVRHWFLPGFGDGIQPYGDLLAGCEFLYGMTSDGGRSGNGAIFRMRPDGGDYAVIHDFSGGPSDGGWSLNGAVISFQGMLYGMTLGGGGAGCGTIFKINPNGSDFQVIHSFGEGLENGYWPDGSLLALGEKLYGVAGSGGINDAGILFQINPDGSGFQIIHSFQGGATEGAYPQEGVIVAEGRIYGVTCWGGNEDRGTIYGILPDGSGFQMLHSFGDDADNGVYPYGKLLPLNGAFYGVTQYGGATGHGCIYKINPDGSGFQLIHSFSGYPDDGYGPHGTLIAVNGVLYGMTRQGGSKGDGTVFSLNPDGSGYQILHSFDSSTGESRYPGPSLIAHEGALYGMTIGDGWNGQGSVFKINPDGSGFSTVHFFQDTGVDGRYVSRIPIQSGGNLYGMTAGGGAGNGGIIYKMHWDGSGYQILHAFMGHPDDGEGPIGPLVEWDGRLFGVTYSGGENNAGILFAIRPDGTDYQILHSFSYFSSDPGYPTGGLAINNGTLIGTTSNGGTAWNGTIYAINPDGSGFQIVHSFTETPDDGYWVGGPLIGVSGELFGMTSGGGVYGHGTIFKLNSDGSAYQILHSFEGADGDGSYPVGSLLYSAGCLYGMTNMGGPADKGTIFKINPDGSGYQVLRALAGGPGDGEWPDGTLMETAGIFYGVTNGGGPDEGGSLFQINPDGGGFAIIRYFSWSTNDGFGAADSLLFINNYLVGTTRYGGVGGGAIFSFRIRPLIAGRVTQDGTGLAGATMSGLPGDPVTDDEGRYEAMVPIGWSGTVTPVLAGYAFTQHFLAYVNIVSDQLGQDFIASISSAPPPVQATGVDAAKFSKNPDGDTLQVTYDAVTCSAQKAILLYGSLGTWNTYSGCADNDLGNMGQDGAVNSSDLENVWFNIVWTNGPIAGHPGFGFNGMVDEPRPWTVGTLCGMTEDDHGHAACP